MSAFPGTIAGVAAALATSQLGESTEVKNVSITTGDVKPDDQNAKFVDSLGGDNEIFTDYKILSRYEHDRHIYMGGVSSPGGFNGASVSFVQLTSPTLLWIVDWTSCKSGTQPEVPDPFSVGSGWVLMDVHLEPGMLAVLADGQTPLWRFSGTYFYGLSNPNANPYKDVTFTRPPYLEDTFTRTVSVGKLTKSLINYGVNAQIVAPGQISAQFR